MHFCRVVSPQKKPYLEKNNLLETHSKSGLLLRNKAYLINDYRISKLIWCPCFLLKFLLILIISLLHCLYLCRLHLSCISVFLISSCLCFGDQLWRTCVHIIIPKATSSVVRVQCKPTHKIMEYVNLNRD